MTQEERGKRLKERFLSDLEKATKVRAYIHPSKHDEFMVTVDKEEIKREIATRWLGNDHGFISAVAKWHMDADGTMRILG